MAAVYPSSHNVFVRDHDASNKLVVDFARNITDFALNQYVQIVPVPKVAGYYLEMTIEEAGRILNDDLRNFIWPDGQPAPEGNEGTESFEYQPFTCVRHAPTFLLGDMTIEEASWNILAQHSRLKAHQAMTARTVKAITALTTQANWATGHVLDITLIAGNTGRWDASTTARQDIRRSLDTAIEVILDDTLAAVNPEDLRLVMNSNCAAKVARSQELVDYIKGSPEALAQIRGELPGRNVLYGLPNRLYGVEVVVEKTRKVTSKKGATKAVTAALAEATPVLVARPGGLEGVADAPTFATCVLFERQGQGMAVETKRDDDNKRTIGRVIDTYDVKLVASISGVMFLKATT